MLLYTLLFTTAILYDVIVVLWFRAMAEKRTIIAALYGPMMVLIANFETKMFVLDNLALIPLCLGTSVGIMLGARLGKVR